MKPRRYCSHCATRRYASKLYIVYSTIARKNFFICPDCFKKLFKFSSLDLIKSPQGDKSWNLDDFR